MLEKSSRKPEIEMAIAIEMKRAILHLAGQRQSEDTRESMIARAARRAGISFRQAKSFFYGETSNPRARVVERVRSAIQNANLSQEAKARAEYQRIREQIAILEQRLAALDQDLGGEGVADFEPAHIVNGSLDSPVDWGI